MEWSFALRGIEAGKGIIQGGPGATSSGQSGEDGDGDEAAKTGDYIKPPWMTDLNWQKLDVLVKLAEFGQVFSYDGLLEHMSKNEQEWYAFQDDDEAIEKPLPGGFDAKLKPIQRLLVMRCLRENFWATGVKRFIREELG